MMIGGSKLNSYSRKYPSLSKFPRSWLVGKGIFGKGVAESALPLSEGTVLILSTAYYFTLWDRSIQKTLPDTALAGILGTGIIETRSEWFFTGQKREIKQQGGIFLDQGSRPWQLDR